MMTVDLQYASTETALPTHRDIHTWADTALLLSTETNGLHSTPEEPNFPAELTVRIVDEEEMRDLNRRYRGQEKTTNVLSFPCDASNFPGLHLLGDIVVCAPVVKREAGEQGKEPVAHWAHMVIHGTLHLMGFDHLSEPQAVQMESLETRILARLGFSDPYR
uniref:Endoribonuclease YbeY n=1 Tax=Candidatus Kentrum sp. DK TaxID=2126562 RepID=A0A450S562_9GAMM|nr:MAG: probable rRNA maturation factor [Candidatus Kentron sp. DK]VFJ47026.1 MAG: probable rRNA maturation factor [Candidatus Kentron sp. DK]